VTIAQYLRLLREQWVIVMALTMFGLLGAGGYTAAATPIYQADTQLFVSTTGQTADLSQLSQGSTFTQQRVKSYSDLVTSPLVLQPVIDQLSLKDTPQTLAKRVTATSPLDTVLIDIQVTDPMPSRASDIANAIADQFPTLVSDLETPKGRTTSPVKVSKTQSAVLPKDPVSPRVALNLALGLLVGLGLGVGGAIVRDGLDRTISGRTQAHQIAGAPVLGAVADEPDLAGKPLITHDAFSGRAEAFRQLRTNIRFLGVDHQVSSLVVTGSVPSEGKSTTAANLAIALAQSGEQVVLIDADLRRPTIADVFGLPSGVGLTSVLLGDVPAEQALQRWRDDLPLSVLAAGQMPPNPSELIGSARMADLISTLTGQGMTVVVDSPPLLPVTDAAILARITDGALVVTRVASTRVEQLTAAVESLRTAGAPILGLVLNRVPRRGKAAQGYGYGYGYGYRGYQPHESTSGAAPEILAPHTVVPAGLPSHGVQHHTLQPHALQPQVLPMHDSPAPVGQAPVGASPVGTLSGAASPVGASPVGQRPPGIVGQPTRRRPHGGDTGPGEFDDDRAAAAGSLASIAMAAPAAATPPVIDVSEPARVPANGYDLDLIAPQPAVNGATNGHAPRTGGFAGLVDPEPHQQAPAAPPSEPTWPGGYGHPVLGVGTPVQDPRTPGEPRGQRPDRRGQLRGRRIAPPHD
jgi:capsular exopolysaccharide synthesis family protein